MPANFVDVILPLAIPKTYTFSIPDELKNKILTGQRVIVQFGKKRFYTAVVKKIHSLQPSYEIKEIFSVLDEQPVVNKKQLQLWEWISYYYLCYEGEVMNAALPSGLKLESETILQLNQEFNRDYSHLNGDEYLIAEALEIKHELTIFEIQKILHKKSVYSVIKSLIEKNVVIAKEELIEKYKPRMESFVKMSDEYQDQEKLKNILNELIKQPKQLELMMTYLQLSRKEFSDSISENNMVSIKKSELLKRVKITSSVLNSLVKKNILQIVEKEVGRLEELENKPNHQFALSEAQQKAFDSIKTNFENQQVVLLHGVTSSGKTEIYVRLIEEVLKKGKQVLYLLPEIALTTQIINRLRRYFGNNVGVYHSKLNSSERVEVWKGLMNDGSRMMENNKSQFNIKHQIILGARSALFLPFDNLGLIIVDEEHDTSYKQVEPAPRYHARDTAIYLAQIHGAKTLLGTATPSVETYFNAQLTSTLSKGEGERKSKYGFVELKERFGKMEMPEIIIADVKQERKKKLMKSHFTSVLMGNLGKVLKNKEQAILFQNRRGFSQFLECGVCNWIPHCINCDVSLTYHKFHHELKCHYCGYSAPPVQSCPACGSQDIKIQGFGTEKIEDELKIFFPEARIARMDLDAVKTKHGHNKIITAFENGELDIMVGTQMVTKGLDFDKVSLVGILSADHLLNFPDFRANERAYQLMAQVSGRAGRKNKRGRVIIQAVNNIHFILQDVMDDHYERFYRKEIIQREKFRYPPFYRLIEITLKHKDLKVVEAAAKFLVQTLRKKLSGRILGPAIPFVSRVRNYYLREMMVKIEREKDNIALVKQLLQQAISELNTHEKLKSVNVLIDVDPY